MAELDSQLKKTYEVTQTVRNTQKFTTFDELYKKVQTSGNPTMRARLDEEFKKQYKILVR